ncbi:YitT family protein [Clostridium sp. MB40-C1]|uniref:YitT family protein n=1 Tax=Clostridium sp. MB40-C1 TaxID=3070996 RepID=UPI0027DF0EB2|nr:YitT family protein [Clostridium sp. MB40-C1]WMJ80814.1 YitT family protein [Clostridium sp. MB40-C1]
MKKSIKEILLLSVGCLLFSLYICIFLIPNNIGTGGLTGISLGLNYLFKIPVGFSTIILNIPLFIFGYNLLGKKFAFKSALIVLISSFIIDFINSHLTFSALGDVLTATIFCGVLSGIAMALLFMSGASTGGLDISGKIIKNKHPNLSLSKILLVQDIVVYLFLALTLGPRSVMYALIMSFIRSKTIDAVQEGFASSRQCIIICQNPDLIINSIKLQLGRGVTLLNAEGCYSHTNKKFIYVVIQKFQLNTLKNIINDIDPTAFVAVSSVNDIQGNFKQKSFSI